jgi:hypothetical protein
VDGYENYPNKAGVLGREKFLKEGHGVYTKDIK